MKPFAEDPQVLGPAERWGKLLIIEDRWYAREDLQGGDPLVFARIDERSFQTKYEAKTCSDCEEYTPHLKDDYICVNCRGENQ